MRRALLYTRAFPAPQPKGSRVSRPLRSWWGGLWWKIYSSVELL